MNRDRLPFWRGKDVLQRAFAGTSCRRLVRLAPLAVLGLLTGCRLILGTTVLAVAAVGTVGYGVYKIGESVVSGTEAVVSGSVRGVSSLVFSEGEFKATCDGTVNAVWLASVATMQTNGFTVVSGNRDALSGGLRVAAWNNEKIDIRLEAADTNRTALHIRVGEAGDLKKSETLYRMIVSELGRQRAPQGQGDT